MKKSFLSLICFFTIPLLGNSQAMSYSDPAAAYLRVVLEKGEGGTYQNIGNFKVTGTSYLYGEKLNGSVFAGNESGSNLTLSYNTYNQQLDIYPNGSSFAIIKPASLVDSFILMKSDQSGYIKENLLFYSSRFFKTDIKPCFFQVVQSGSRFCLYKAYSSSLDIVSTNYIQSDLRQFTLDVTYYYYDATTQKLKKLKTGKGKLMDEFKSIMDISSFLDDNYNSHQEESLRQIFNALNQKAK